MTERSTARPSAPNPGSDLLGERLFQWRSWWPLALVPGIGIMLGLPRVWVSSERSENGWELCWLAVALAWWFLRAYTVGTVAPGSSGRSTLSAEAPAINTTGPYSVVRHPLYLANIGIATCLGLFTHSLYSASFVFVVVTLYFSRVAHYEDAYLKSRFGDTFERWAARVPSWWPRMLLYLPPDQPLIWRRVVRREFYAFSAVLVLALLLDSFDEFKEGGRPMPDPIFLWLGAIGAVLFFVFRAAKKRRWI